MTKLETPQKPAVGSQVDRHVRLSFEEHPGPLVKGDVIVLEIYGKIVPRRPDDARPQVFIVQAHQDGNGQVPLIPVSAVPRGCKPRLYKCGWKA